MIYNQNMAQQYNRNKVLTASPAELTLLLYEGAIKFCNIAVNSLLMDNPLETPKIINGMEGGIIGAIMPPEAISPAARLTG